MYLLSITYFLQEINDDLHAFHDRVRGSFYLTDSISGVRAAFLIHSKVCSSSLNKQKALNFIITLYGIKAEQVTLA